MNPPLERLAPRTRVLVLQHPQEPDEVLGTARLLTSSLEGSALRVGLSWPNLAKALGDTPADPSSWIVLYLGTGAAREALKKSPVVTGRLKLLKGPSPADKPPEGLVVLDGTWSQAKALWWRNAWLLKLRRGILEPEKPSLYGRLRREPRRECLSSLEAAAEALDALGEDPAIGAELRSRFDAMLAPHRKGPPAKPPVDPS